MTDFARKLELHGALWRFDTHPNGAQGAHAILTSGAHSDGFINISEFGTYAWDLADACAALARKVEAEHGVVRHDIDWIVTTTGGTSMMTARVLKDLGCNIIPVIPTLVSRMAEDEIIGPDNMIFKVACLTKLIFRTWKVQSGEKCELCELGSPALKPKAHWDQFRMDC